VLYDFFVDIQNTGSPSFIPRGFSIEVITSTDQGNTWSAPTLVSNENVANDVDPVTGQAMRTAEELHSAAIDPNTGQLYVVWEDARFTGGSENQVVISTSKDGSTWSAPQAISGTPTNFPAFTPTVTVNSAGTVAVTYYDLRNQVAANAKTGTIATDVWLKTSVNAGASFGPDTHVAGSFNMAAAPKTGAGFFLGDYQGLGASGTTLLPFFVQTNCLKSTCASNPTDVYTGQF
jgi:hypothetical protein